MSKDNGENAIMKELQGIEEEEIFRTRRRLRKDEDAKLRAETAAFLLFLRV